MCTCVFVLEKERGREGGEREGGNCTHSCVAYRKGEPQLLLQIKMQFSPECLFLLWCASPAPHTLPGRLGLWLFPRQLIHPIILAVENDNIIIIIAIHLYRSVAMYALFLMSTAAP